MIHFREDYNRIQDPENKIPKDEPVFLLRAQDKFMLPILALYCELNEQFGTDIKISDLILEGMQMVEEWQQNHGVKYPDL